MFGEWSGELTVNAKGLFGSSGTLGRWGLRALGWMDAWNPGPKMEESSLLGSSWALPLGEIDIL